MLPPPKQPTPAGFNVWALIKDFVGKGDLSKMATPVQYLEPLSELQQRCEDLEYSELLDQAGTNPKRQCRSHPVASFGRSLQDCNPSAVLGAPVRAAAAL